MEIYDISQEVFGCEVYPGDPSPARQTLSSIAKGDLYNLTAFSMCAHNGTHIDAPAHFIEGGRTVDMLPLESLVGKAYVAQRSGELDAEGARELLREAREKDLDASARLLIKGEVILTLEAAEELARAGLTLVGVESQTVGPENAPMAVHLALLGADVIILEGLRLQKVPKGVYLLNAAPLSLAGSDGAPCRAWLARL